VDKGILCSFSIESWLEKDMEGAADKDQLLHRYFEAVNNLYPPWRGEDVLVKVARVVNLKSKIHQLDPSWKLLDSDNGRVAKILMYLDQMDVDAKHSYNHSLGLKVCEELRSISPWRLDKEVVRNFNSERKQEPEKKPDLNLPQIAVHFQVTLGVEKKNDEAPDSLEEEEEDEEDEKKKKKGAEKAFSFPFVFVKDLK
jgi:hypothetical protein